MSTKYIENGMLTEHALLTRELAGRIQVNAPQPTITGKREENVNQSTAPSDTPFDFPVSKPTFLYPDGNSDRSLYFPKLIIYNKPNASGNNQVYPVGYPTGLVAYTQPMFQRGRSSVVMANKKYSHPPEVVWGDLRVYPDKPTGEKQMQIIVTGINKKTGKRFTSEFDDLPDVFSKMRGAVAFRANVTGAVNFQAQINKGSQFRENDEMKCILIPSKITILGPADVPEPVVNASRKSATNKNDDADESFMEMLMRDGEEDNEEEEEEEEEEAED